MPVFWKSSRDNTRRPAGRPDAVSPWAGEGVLHSADWAEIEGLLDAANAADATSPPDAAETADAGAAEADPSGAILDALTELRALIDNPVLPAGRISDRLLDIWALTNQVRPEAAAPAASLMTALLHRDLASAAEVSATCDEIEQLLAVPA